MVDHILDQGVEHATGIFPGGEEGVALGHAYAQERLLLHQRHPHPPLGEITGRDKPGDPSADDQGFRMDRYAPFVEGEEMADPADSRPNQAYRLLGCQLMILAHPRHLFAEVYMLEKIRIETSAGDRAPEGDLMERGGTGSDYDPIEPQFADLLFDKRLSRVRADEMVICGEYDSREPGDFLGHPLDINNIRDVTTAVADKHPDPGGSIRFVAASRANSWSLRHRQHSSW
jgi:hypothetical protein